ncbi:MAG: hypothetical protein JNM24_13440 [Bdellovibrionaceae bacterium]|nr:hypothetical protein [Pseudobdellovibrionaceae bacterium]
MTDPVLGDILISMRFQLTTFLSLIRSLFPRWDFFDQVAFSFNVFFKTSPDPSWKRLSFDQPHKNLRILFNPIINNALVEASIVEHFARDIQELEKDKPDFNTLDLDNLTSYQLLCSLLQVKLKRENLQDDGFQFKIVAHGTNSTIDIYTSQILPLVNK